MNEGYKDIINHPHHVSEKRPQMSMADRAAQFAPFAALVGYDDAIKETDRIVENKIDIDDEAKAVLDAKQHVIEDELTNKPEILVTYFLPDKKKAGGKNITTSGVVKRFDQYERIILFMDGQKVPMDDIVDIDSELFRKIELD